MPKSGGKSVTENNRTMPLLKRCVTFAFAAAGLIFGLDQLGFESGSLASLVGAQQRASRIQRMTSSDCTFLREPENYRGVEARHRLDVSRTTESIGRVLEQENLSLVTADQIPRKNVIDEILFDRMSSDGIASAPLTTDAEFLRRVTIDLTGRIPSPDEVTRFLQDANPYKREALVDSLIRTEEFTDKWTMFFGDLYKNSSNATNITRYIIGRESFHKYIRDSIAQNKSYAQMAVEMIAGDGDNNVNGAVNFTVGGNVPMGPAQDTMDGLAVQASSVFLGLSSMDCLLCHNGAGHLDAINLWGSQVTRADAWGMSAFFARTRRQFTRESTSVNYGKYTISENANGEYQLNTNSGNRQTRAPINGKNTVDPKYLFGGTVNTGENRRQALARMMTADRQFARATVNYIWEELMVEALVSPSNTFDMARISPDAQMPDGWSLQPSNPELLEALSQEFIQSGYNLRYLIGLIAKSSAYQLSSQYPGTWKVEYVPYYARKFARRLDAEEIHDAIVKATAILPVTTYRETGATTNQTIIGYPIMSDDGRKLREVTWAMQLPEPLEPRQRGDVRTFLDSFLRGNRDSNSRTQDSSILQALNLMNNTFVMDRIHQGNRVINVPNTPEIPSTVRRLLADTTLTNDQIITQLYLHTLSRYPTEAEKTKALTYYTSMGKQAATESLQWVLLNKVDFIFNY